ncbi:NUDIX domain-containing protein [Edaphobacter sp. 12200R-103]|uniref:NUDIX domain-containing protein n=1 Tax=Edaphobacter sp. 12200R-103 TaxID=2703788 RepID=UPI00138CAFAF|nr:NUDIX domain-containing protein [Edaphobacter sp. 12200R-103]QHS52693.1 NUDIX domain-containing protein [Edaphobacter sp. 12200R-103]
MPKRSAGLLMYRYREDVSGTAPDATLEVFLVHPGGPFWAKKDLGAWTIPKGEYSDDEDPLAAAIREFREETGFTAEGNFLPLGEIRQTGGKLVTLWAIEGDCDPDALVSMTFEMEWPPRSGRRAGFPEVDRGAWFPLTEARTRILASQQPALERLVERIPGPRSASTRIPSESTP